MQNHSANTNPGPENIQEDQAALQSFFYQALCKLYWAESSSLPLLEKLRAGAGTRKLKGLLELHIAQTTEQVERLKKSFTAYHKKPEMKTCEAMEGLLRDGRVALETTKPGTRLRDLNILSAARKLEHYEMATYIVLIQMAALVDMEKIVSWLEASLGEEKQMDMELTSLLEKRLDSER